MRFEKVYKVYIQHSYLFAAQCSHMQHNSRSDAHDEILFSIMAAGQRIIIFRKEINEN